MSDDARRKFAPKAKRICTRLLDAAVRSLEGAATDRAALLAALERTFAQPLPVLDVRALPVAR